MDYVSILPFSGSAQISSPHTPGTPVEGFSGMPGRQISQVYELGMFMGRYYPLTQECTGLYFTEICMQSVSQKEICSSQLAGELGCFVTGGGEQPRLPKGTGFFQHPVLLIVQFSSSMSFSTSWSSLSPREGESLVQTGRRDKIKGKQTCAI